MFRYKKTILVLIIVFFFALYTQITIFVIQPLDALPKGVIVIMLKKGNLEFIDSADAVCQRIQGKVTLICRGLIIAEIAKNSTVLFRLPYSKFIYQISTGWKTYLK